MTGDQWDELLVQGRKKLADQKEEERILNAEVGIDMSPAEDDHFLGRWRADVGRMITKAGKEVEVYLVWNRNGDPGYLRRHAKLVIEVDVEKPKVGDIVAVLRGPTEFYEWEGEQRKSYPYVLRVESCKDPLPGTAAIPPGEKPAADDDIPF
jgi:hypothetical protein